VLRRSSVLSIWVKGHWVQVVPVTINSVQLCQQFLPTISITTASSTLPFQLPLVPDQPQIRASETKPNPNLALTLILTLLTLLTPRCNMIGRSVAARCYWSGAIVDRSALSCFCPYTHTHMGPSALPGPLKWSITTACI